MLLGGFDGLHIGHRRLLSRAKQSGLPVGIMTITGAKEGNLFTLREREQIFAQAGADFVCELSFDAIKDISAQDFLGKLIEEFSPKLFLCGEDFRFGAGAVGTSALIEKYAGIPTEVHSLVQCNGEKVSSRTVKALLSKAQTQRAADLLGEEFFLIGEVFSDRKVGRTIGFPTANILYPTEKFPLKTGVYQTRVLAKGKWYHAITNYGARPTFENDRVVTESYLDGFEGDLYGEEIQIRFTRYLREVRKFESVSALQAQLREDIRRVREND